MSTWYDAILSQFMRTRSSRQEYKNNAVQERNLCAYILSIREQMDSFLNIILVRFAKICQPIERCYKSDYNKVTLIESHT